MARVQIAERGRGAIVAVLRSGSIFSMVVLVLGVALALVHPDSGAAAIRGPHDNFLMKARALDPRAVTGLGILLLLLTPVFRVFAAVITFGLERDLKYFLISSGVLLIVLASIAFSVG